jgi:transcription initiation factor TFIIIB Brf1 subunit/transcription initiation factor TFIIB
MGFVSKCQVIGAMRIFKEIKSELNHRAAPKFACIAACLYFHCKTNGMLLDRNDLCRVFSIDSTKLSKSLSEVSLQIKRKGINVDTSPAKPSMILKNICNKCSLSDEDFKRLDFALELISHDDDLERHGTKSLISALLILYRNGGKQYGYDESAKVCEVTVMTVKNCEKKIKSKFSSNKMFT